MNNLYYFDKYKSHQSDVFIGIPSAKEPRIILSTYSKAVFKNGLRIHNTAALKNKLIKGIIKNSYNIVSKIDTLKLFPNEKLEHLIKYTAERGNLEDEIKISMYLGTNSINQKYTIQIMTKTGEIIGYLKVGVTKQSIVYMKNEYSIIELLKQSRIQHFVFPNNIFCDNYINSFIMLQNNIFDNSTTISNCINDNIFRCVVEIGKVKQANASNEIYLNNISLNIQHLFSQNILNEDLCKKIEKIIRDLKRINFPFVLVHGDFVSYNMRMKGDRIGVLDWEFSRQNGLPLFDILHFIYQGGIQINNYKPEKLLKNRIENRNRKYLIRYLDDFNISDFFLRHFISLYLLESLIFDLNNRPTQMLENNHFLAGLKIMLENRID